MANKKDVTLSNDLFRFVSVRAINTYASDALDRRYILLSNDPDAAIVKNNNPNLQMLLLSLDQFKDYTQDRLRVLIEQVRGNSNLIISPEQFEKDYPFDVRSVQEWINVTPQAKRSALIAQINTVLRSSNSNDDTPIKNFLNSQSYVPSKIRLYETLAAYYLDPHPEDLLDTIQQVIRLFWIMQRLSNPDGLFATKLPDDPAAFAEAINATIVLPFQTGYADTSEIPSEPANEEEDKPRRDAERRLDALNQASNEIEGQRRAQEIDDSYSAKYCEDPKSSTRSASHDRSKAAILASRYVGALSNATHEIIDSYRIPKRDGLDIGHIVGRINDERGRIIDRYYPPSKPQITININGRIMQTSEPCTPYNYDPCAKYPLLRIQYQKLPVRTPGWADLKVIKSTLLKYDKGEIAHIENILKSEVKIHEFNTTTRTEETLFTEEEVTTENVKEAQTTDRFELEKELSEQTKEDMKFDTGVKVSAKLGSVQLDTHLDFAYSNSKEESNKTSTRTAQETMNRALSRIIERKKTQKTVTTIVTTEDKNSHTFKNDDPKSDNIHGMYFWVDKYYLAKVVNYGSRLMLEFMVPEPAAFFLYSKTHKPQPDSSKVKPEYPQVRDAVTGKLRSIESFKDITEDNYSQLAARYEAQDVKPPDGPLMVITESIEVKGQAEEVVANERDGKQTKYKQASAISKAIQVPDGYLPERGWVTIAGWGVDINLPVIQLLLGTIKRSNADFQLTQEFFPLNDESKIVPFAAWGYDTGGFVLNVEVRCRRTDKHFQEWQISTYNSILTAYSNQLKAYYSWMKEQEIQSGVTIQGNNPEMNRRVEREELKKLCIELMTGQYFQSFNAVNNNVAPLGYPEVIPLKAFEQGEHIQFFEQAFEWEQATYVFYPYFWGRKPNWVMIKSINDTDPVFTSFLQAGAARVLVPTRPGFEDSVYYFLATRRIWHGKNPPIPGDKLWISIVDELKAQQGQFDGGNAEGTPWIYKLPTTLVYLEQVKFTIEDTDASPKYPNDLKQIEDAKTSADFS